jgi:hypothetical protein
VIRAYRAFAIGSSKEMRRVQLFFVKLFGCAIVDSGAPIDISSFASALLNEKFHPDIFLKFGYVPREDQIVGLSPLVAAHHPKTKQLVAASIFYELGSIAVRVIYSPDHNAIEDTDTAWHPAYDRGRIEVHDFGPILKSIE